MFSFSYLSWRSSTFLFRSAERSDALEKTINLAFMPERARCSGVLHRFQEPPASVIQQAKQHRSQLIRVTT